jgi:hypothetical protein
MTEDLENKVGFWKKTALKVGLAGLALYGAWQLVVPREPTLDDVVRSVAGFYFFQDSSEKDTILEAWDGVEWGEPDNIFEKKYIARNLFAVLAMNNSEVNHSALSIMETYKDAPGAIGCMLDFLQDAAQEAIGTAFTETMIDDAVVDALHRVNGGSYETKNERNLVLNAHASFFASVFYRTRNNSTTQKAAQAYSVYWDLALKNRKSQFPLHKFTSPNHPREFEYLDSFADALIDDHVIETVKMYKEFGAAQVAAEALFFGQSQKNPALFVLSRAKELREDVVMEMTRKYGWLYREDQGLFHDFSRTGLGTSPQMVDFARLMLHEDLVNTVALYQQSNGASAILAGFAELIYNTGSDELALRAARIFSQPDVLHKWEKLTSKHTPGFSPMVEEEMLKSIVQFGAITDNTFIAESMLELGYRLMQEHPYEANDFAFGLLSRLSYHDQGRYVISPFTLIQEVNEKLENIKAKTR